MSSYAKAVKEITQSSPQALRCRSCGATTAFETLSSYGARCGACYADYCRAKQYFPDTGDKRIDGPRGWAHALKRRHEQGDRLTPAQVSAYKAALRTTEEDGPESHAR
jgi:protein-arginine kinase activator protein McsA